MLNTSIYEWVSDLDIESWILDLSNNSEKLSKLSWELLEQVVWQKGAKEVLENILEEVIAWVNLRKNWYNKPMASMIFAWPSWVWKTLLARVTQEILNKHFKSSLELVKINCADFSWETWYSLSRLTGASAGFIWSDRKPQLHPDNIDWKGRVILLDEIEKAWTPFWNMLLSILDDWTLDVNYTKPNPNNSPLASNLNYTSGEFKEKKTLEKDSYLRAYFKDSIIIMTSNVWNDRINKEISQSWIWFNLTKTKIEDLNMEWIILEEFWKQFKIEMQWRFDYVVPFDHLVRQDAQKIIDQLINRLIGTTLSNWNWFVIEFSVSAKNIILNQIIDSENFRKFGGRYIEWYFKKNILPFIARAINSWKFREENLHSCLLVGEKEWEIFFSKIPIVTNNDINEKVVNLLEK